MASVVKHLLLAALGLAMLAAPYLVPRALAASSALGVSESQIRSCLCKGLAQEQELKGGGYADCLSDTHAIEVGVSEDWANHLGQSLYYAADTGLEPAIYMYCSPSSCESHIKRVEIAKERFSLPIDFRVYSDDELKQRCEF